MPTTRTFVSLALPRVVRSGIAELVARERHAAPASLRWSDPHSAHLTLAFLGDVEESSLQDVLTATSRAASTAVPFAAQLCGAGAFPAANRARVVWLRWGEGEERVRALQATLATELAEAGFTLDRRPFEAHVTLARARAPADVTRVLDTLREWRSEPWQVRAVDVMASRLTREGAIHTLLGRSPLQGCEARAV